MEEVGGKKRLRVAVLDDSEELRAVALSAFSEAGMDAFVAERETVDLEQVVQWDPDVVLVDPQGMADAARRPFEVALAMRDDPRLANVPVVLLAAPWTLWQHESEVQLVSPTVTLNKPVSVSELVDAVRVAAGAGSED
jgi:CheY-like chemotaxis protein